MGGGGAALVRVAQVPVPPGGVENGEVRQPGGGHGRAPRAVEAGGFKNRQVYMGVGNQRVVVREVSLPWLPVKELRESLPLQVQEFIPIAVRTRCWTSTRSTSSSRRAAG